MERVIDIMVDSPLVTIRPDASAAEAALVIQESGVSHLLVTRGTELVGVVCICDLDTAHSLQDVATTMRASPVCIEPHCQLAEAAQLMRQHRVSVLPVVDDGQLVGVVSRRDLRSSGLVVDALDGVAHCAACGSDDHVRPHRHMPGVEFCLQCERRSTPPAWDDDEGAGG